MSEKYNYLEQVTSDAKDAILEHMGEWDFDDRDELEQVANDELWIDDSVTGNASGSYYCSIWKAEEALCHNWDLVIDIMDEGGIEASDLVKGPEWLDVTIRCWLLGAAIAQAIDELEADRKISYPADDAEE